MSSGGQSNASQTPFAPNYGQAQGISGLGAGLTGGGFGSNMGGGNAYAQKFKQPSMGMFPPTSPQPQQGQPQPPPGLTVNTPGTQNGVSGYYSDSSMSNFVPDTPAGSFLGGPYDPAGGYFGGGFGGGREYTPPPGMELNPDYNLPPGTVTTANTPRGRFRPIQARTGTDQPPPGMMLNPEYGGDLPSGTFRSLGPDSIKYVPDPNQPQPQTGGDIQYRDTKFRPGGGDIQYAGGTPGFYNQGGQGYGNPFGGFGGGYDQGYGNPFGGGFGGGYDQGYGNPFGGFGGGYGGGYGNPFGGYGGGYGGFNPMMGMGLGGMLGGYQGGFNPQSQAQAQMRAYQQNQQRQGGRGGFEGGDIQGNMAFDRRRMEALIDRPQQSRMIPLDQPDSNSFSLTRSYMDPVSGKISTVY